MGFVDSVMNEKVRLSSKNSVGMARRDKQDGVLWMTWELRLKKTQVWRDFALLLGSAVSSLRPLSAGSIATEILGSNPQSGGLEIRAQLVWLLGTCVSIHHILEVPF